MIISKSNLRLAVKFINNIGYFFTIAHNVVKRNQMLVTAKIYIEIHHYNESTTISLKTIRHSLFCPITQGALFSSHVIYLSIFL